MDSIAAQRRLKAIHGHLAVDGDSFPQLRPNLTAGEFFIDHGYSVVLPEKLQTGKWNVHRSAYSPLKLVSRFHDHPEIGTQKKKEEVLRADFIEIKITGLTYEE